MSRSKRLDGTMDKQWEAERRGAKRAEVRLNNGIQQIEEAQLYHVNTMTREQKKLQMDLIKMKQASAKSKTTTRSGVPPGKPALHPTGGRGQLLRPENHAERTRKQSASRSNGPVMASGSSMTLQMRINDFMDGVGKKGKMAEPPVSGMSVTDVGNSIARRLSISGNSTVTEVRESNNKDQDSASGVTMESSDKSLGSSMKSLQETSTRPIYVTPPSARSRRGSLFKEKLYFDEETYAPDGGLRTLHTMPSAMDSFEEAKKARYIRHSKKIESERELSVQEIFQREQAQDDEENYSDS
ncbi:Hypothetical predicted protein [Pelobates cultripes]|uniref:Uncharacterized protein n=1 Tax=Pelobates cultripes TaxID=61616 RepID=A0AAD1WLZ2_PELCU|nr:Hypothetical predicted protein [Pelobates cultripes]